MKNPPGMQNETRRTVEVCPKAYIQTLYFEYCLEFSSGMISVNPAGLVVQLLSRTPPDKSVIKAIYIGELNTHAAHSLRLIPVIV